MNTNTNLENFKKLISPEESGWSAKSEWDYQNRDWLAISAKIAVGILRKLNQNKKSGLSPTSQKELAEVMQVSPQQVNKIVKGQENLTLETICKLEAALEIELINTRTTAIENKAVVLVTTAIHKIYHKSEKSSTDTPIKSVFKYSNRPIARC